MNLKRIGLFLNGEFQTCDFELEIINPSATPVEVPRDDTLLPTDINQSKTKILRPTHLSKQNNKNEVEFYLADGGLNYFMDHQFFSSSFHWVGDADSLNEINSHFIEENCENKNKITRLNTNKDFSDLACILDIILEKKITEPIFIEIYGGLGKRRDHEIANIMEIKNFLSAHPKGGVAYFHGGVVLTTLPIHFLKTPSKGFSILDSQGMIEIKGARYSGSFLLNRPSYGLSNEIVNSSFSVSPQAGVMTLYFY